MDGRKKIYDFIFSIYYLIADLPAVGGFQKK